MTRPLFSIVMPTRNRPHLLRYSLKTALEQRFEDFEVVVSDNSSDRATRDLVAGFDSPHLRYFKTGRTLSMPDSWEFALKHARGRYITYLCDDDALVPGLLSEIATVLSADGHIQLIQWGHALYVHQSWFEPGVRNTIHVPEHTGEFTEVPSQQRLNDLYALCLWECPKPLMLNSLCSDRIIQTIREDAGRVFIPPAPDYSFGASALAATTSFLHVDRPLAINGAAKESIGMSGFHGDRAAVTTFVEEFGGEAVLPEVQIPLLTGINIISQTLVNVSRQNQRVRDLDLRIDLVEYFVATHRELRVWELNGVDVGKAFKHLRTALRHQPLAVRSEVEQRLRWQASRRLLRRRINASRLLRRIEGLLRASDSTPPAGRILQGLECGFGDIHGCARWLDSYLASRPAILSPSPSA